MLTLGVVATLLANADFGSTHGAAGIIMSAWPGVAFVGSAEVPSAWSASPRRRACLRSTWTSSRSK
jgi:hypothetical protein